MITKSIRGSVVCLVVIAVCLLAASIASAEYTRFWEDFESGTVPNDITTVGWSYFRTPPGSPAYVSNTLVDSGKSAESSVMTSWVEYIKPLSSVYVRNGDTIALTGTVLATDKGYTALSMQTSAGGEFGIYINTNAGKFTLLGGSYTGSYWYTAPLPRNIDLMVSTMGSGTYFRWRQHGTTTWTLAGSTSANMVDVATVRIGRYAYAGATNSSAWDSIRVTSLVAPPVPEPSSVLALTTGLLGLVGLVSRRRK